MTDVVENFKKEKRKEISKREKRKEVEGGAGRKERKEKEKTSLNPIRVRVLPAACCQ